MINNTKINAEIFKNMFISGAINLKNNYIQINNLNVFPIPDGDTGNNMKITMMHGVGKIQNIKSNSIIEITEQLSQALLLGAQGNSGVIISQFFLGIHLELKKLKKHVINITEFIKTLNNGYQQAYEAISTPVEGTILTVIRESINNIIIDESTTLRQIIEIIVNKAEKALKKTTNLLPVLKKAKVVDSGGAGFLEILKGMLFFCQGVQLKDYNQQNIIEKTNELSYCNTVKDNFQKHEIKYIYCSEFIINSNKNQCFDLKLIKEYINQHGDSVVCITYQNILKIHIHTNSPGEILTFLLNYGSLDKIKIDNMKKQFEKIVQKPILNKKIPTIPMYALIAIVPNNSMIKTFKDLNIDYVIDGGPDMTIEINSLKKIIDKQINAQKIIILPNNLKLYNKLQDNKHHLQKNKIHIIKTTNLAQGYSGMLSFDFNMDLNYNLTNFDNVIKNTTVGKITKNKDINNINQTQTPENFVCIINDKTIYSHNNIDEITYYLIKKIIKNNTEFLTIFYNKQDVPTKNFQQLEIFLKQHYSELEIEIIENNEKNILYIFIVE